MGEDLLGEREARRGRDTAFGLDFGDDGGVVGRINDHGDGLVVLGGGADHRRAADVDVLDGVFKRAVRLGDAIENIGLAIVCSNG